MTVKIPIKKNKKGTFLDLSESDLRNNSFSEDFDNFTKEIASFLSGSSVSLIVDKNFKTDNLFILEDIRQKLNQNNISLKAVVDDNDESLPLLSKEAQRPIPMAQEVVEPSTDREIVDTSSLPETLYVESNLRSGQLIRYPGNVFVLGDVNPSAEIVAAGDIIIWGTLRGNVHAGADGDSEAKIIAMEIHSGQIRIADKLMEKIVKDKRKRGEKVPELVKIENREIIVKRYFKN